MDQKKLAPPKTNLTWLWIVLAIVLIIILSFNFGKSSTDFSKKLNDKKVGIVYIEGPIISSERINKDLESFALRDDVSSIVIRVDSPGGSVAPTEEIYEKIINIKKNKPVIVSVGNVAASGGYYISLAADSIFVNRGSIIGSIGVIMAYPIMTDLLDKIGIDFETVKSGQLKDSGSFSRAVNEEDRKHFSDLISNIYEQFIDIVEKNRSMERSKILELADGRVFTGLMSKELGLVDEIGTFEKAINVAGELGNIIGKPKTIRIERKSSIIKELLSAKLINKIQTKWFDKMPVYQWRME